MPLCPAVRACAAAGRSWWKLRAAARAWKAEPRARSARTRRLSRGMHCWRLITCRHVIAAVCVCGAQHSGACQARWHIPLPVSAALHAKLVSTAPADRTAVPRRPAEPLPDLRQRRSRRAWGRCRAGRCVPLLKRDTLYIVLFLYALLFHDMPDASCLLARPRHILLYVIV